MGKPAALATLAMPLEVELANRRCVGHGACVLGEVQREKCRERKCKERRKEGKGIPPRRRPGRKWPLKRNAKPRGKHDGTRQRTASERQRRGKERERKKKKRHREHKKEREGERL